MSLLEKTENCQLFFSPLLRSPTLPAEGNVAALSNVVSLEKVKVMAASDKSHVSLQEIENMRAWQPAQETFLQTRPTVFFAI